MDIQTLNKLLKKGCHPIDISLLKWDVPALDPKDPEDQLTMDRLLLGRNCALCVVYKSSNRNIKCSKCPIYEDTGLHNCLCTPYWPYAEMIVAGNYTKAIDLIKPEFDYLMKIRAKIRDNPDKWGCL